MGTINSVCTCPWVQFKGGNKTSPVSTLCACAALYYYMYTVAVVMYVRDHKDIHVTDLKVGRWVSTCTQDISGTNLRTKMAVDEGNYCCPGSLD